jgi:hypothetical protein
VVDFIAPQQVVYTASQWTLADYVTKQLRSTAAGADGLCTITFPQLDDNQLWLVDHAVAYCTSTTPTTVRLYANAISDLNLLDGSAGGNFDVADWPRGLQVQPTTSLLVQWAGASLGAVGTITVQAESLRR